MATIHRGQGDSVAMNAFNSVAPVVEDGDSETGAPEACWPVSLAMIACSRFSERACLALS